jgi:hypothetical protein
MKINGNSKASIFYIDNQRTGCGCMYIQGVQLKKRNQKKGKAHGRMLRT